MIPLGLGGHGGHGHLMAIRRQGVGLVRSKKVRIASLFVSLASLLALTGLLAPGALGATEGLELSFVEGRGPTNAVKNATITSAAFDPSGLPVQVQATVDGVPTGGISVTLEFADGSEVGTISGNTATTEEETGYATFPNLKIAEENEPMSTDYQLVATETPIEITIASLVPGGAVSGTFDIWGAGDSCAAGETCQANIRGNEDKYSLTTPGTLGASQLAGTLVPFTCAGQTQVFFSSVFVHETTDTDNPTNPGPVFLTSHITRAQMKTVANNGQVFVKWCLALKSAAPWVHNHTAYTEQTVNGKPMFVGIAPKCPSKSAKTFAPCITKQRSDGVGGNITEGWLPGGIDPPRRT